MAEPAENRSGQDTSAETGPVEREARQLVEAAARWLSAVPDRREYADRSVDREADAEAAAGSGDPDGDGAGPGGAEESAATGASGEHLCRGCPWCRAKAATAGPIGADALESLAHLLGSAAESLALFAQSRRETAEQMAHEAERAAEDDEAADQPDHGDAAAADKG